MEIRDASDHEKFNVLHVTEFKTFSKIQRHNRGERKQSGGNVKQIILKTISNTGFHDTKDPMLRPCRVKRLQHFENKGNVETNGLNIGSQLACVAGVERGGMRGVRGESAKRANVERMSRQMLRPFNRALTPEIQCLYENTI